MLLGLEPHVARIVTERPSGPEWESKFSCAVMPRGSGSFTQGVLRRLGLVQRRMASRAQISWLSAQLRKPEVTSVLVPYIPIALMYEPAWRRTDKPVFVHCHGYDVTWDLHRYNQPEVASHTTDYTRRTLEMSKYVQYIANSEITKRRLLDIGIPEDRIHVKYLGVPVPEQPVDRTKQSNEEGVHILYLGRLVDFKGPDLTIQAFIRACEKGLKGKLTVAGDGPLMEKCKELRAESPVADRIELLGAVDEATGEKLRAEADIFTAHNQKGPVTRQEEAFGVSIAEAMADCLPVVTGRNGSIPELITDGKEGLLFTPGDVAAQADAFLHLAGDAELRAELGRNGWQRVRERFTIQREMNTLRSLLGLPLLQEPAA